MTREEAIKKHYKIKCHIEESKKILNLINDIYDSFEEREMFLATKDLCSDSCKHYLSDNGNYPLEPCGSCTRFYADMWEQK